MRRRWLAIGALAVAFGAGWVVARRRPFSARLAWLLTMPGARGLAEARELAGLLQVGAGMRVLDAGAGPGRLTIPFAEAVGPAGSVTAVDVQPRMLEMVRQRAAERGLRNVRLLLADLGRGTLATFEPASYDRALLVHVLGETDDPAAALREVAAALVPGGRLAIVEHLGDPHYVRYQRVRQLAEAAGLRLAGERRSLFGHTTIWEKPDEPEATKGAE